MEYSVKVFKREATERHQPTIYRFAVLDNNKSTSYPSNFVCILPAKVDLVKGKSANSFGKIFGDKSLGCAIELLNKALKIERDAEVKTEIERRLKILDPKQAGSVECYECKKIFRPAKMRKHKRYFCSECYAKKFGHVLNNKLA